MKVNDYIRKHDLEEVNISELVGRIARQAMQDFDKYFSESAIDWMDDITTAENNGVCASFDDNKALYECYIEISEKQHIETYRFYVLYGEDGENDKYYLETN